MTDTVDYLGQFSQFYGQKQGASKAITLLSSDDVRNKVQARRVIRKQAKIPKAQNISDPALEKLAAGYEAQANDQLYGYFGENKEAIVNDPRLNPGLEAKFIDIAPVEIEGDERHNDIAKIHASYLGVRELNKKFDEKKISFSEYVAPMADAAYNQTKAELDKNKYLTDGTKELMAEAQAELIGQSELMARQIGKQMEGQAKKALTDTLGDMEKSKGKDRYSRVQYARENLLHNEQVEYVVEMVGQCLPKPKKKK